MNWFKIENKTANENNIWIYDEIGLGDNNAKSLIHKIDRMDKTKPLNVFLNSPGGDLFCAISLVNYLKNYMGKTTAFIEGLAASAASYLACSMDYTYGYPQSLLMVHACSTSANGNSNDFRQLADRLEKVNEGLIESYQRKSKQPIEVVKSWVEKEVWFTAKEAKDVGLIDQIIDKSVKNFCYTFQNIDYNRKRVEIITDRINRKFGRV